MEAAERLARYGQNKLEGKPKKSLLSLFFAQLQDMLIYVLLGAAVITLFIGEYADSAIILLVVLLLVVLTLLAVLPIVLRGGGHRLLAILM